MGIDKNFVKDLSKEFENAYINICNYYGLKINLEGENYTKEILHSYDNKIISAYEIVKAKIKFAYCIKYIKSVSPINLSLYRKQRKYFMGHYKDYRKCYIFLLVSMTSDVHDGWVNLLHKVKR